VTTKIEVEVLDEGFVIRTQQGGHTTAKVASNTGEVIRQVNVWIQGAVGRAPLVPKG
jgi:hypothetical protein